MGVVVLKLCRLKYLTAPRQVLLGCELWLLKPFLGGIQHPVLAQAASLQLGIQHTAITEQSEIYIVSLI